MSVKKTKIKTIVIDTNVYGWYQAYVLKGSRKPEAVNSFNLLSKILESKKPTVLATETIETEIKHSENPSLSQLFYSVAGGIIKKSEKIEDLSRDYYKSCQKERLRFVTIADCEIAASAVIAGVKILVTENRKTLNNPKVVAVISKINTAKNLGKLKIRDSKNAFGDVFA